MREWRRFLALTSGDRALIVEAAALLCAIRAAVAVLPFSFSRRVLRALPPSRSIPECSAAESVRSIAWAVRSAAARLPVRTTCLVDALAGEAMLARRDVACELRFGVRSAPGVFSAHAWIEHEGAVVLGAVEDLADYSVLSSASGSL
jgi:Transglutaminase-like superfamily